jgi:hypothetical protein
VRALAPLAVAALALLASASPAGAGGDASGLAVSAWPARVVVNAPGTTTVAVGNPGREPIVLVARPRAYALDAHGRPRIEAAAARWLAVRPVRFTVPPHGTVQLRVSVRRPAGAGPGDHAELVLLSTEPPDGRRVFARLRIGVVVVVRVPGRLVHRLGLGRLRLASRQPVTRLQLVVVNRGNVEEWLERGRISVSLVRGGWRLASAPIATRRLLARSSGLVEARFRRPLRGWVTAVVVVRRPGGAGHALRRSYRVKL